MWDLNPDIADFKAFDFKPDWRFFIYPDDFLFLSIIFNRDKQSEHRLWRWATTLCYSNCWVVPRPMKTFVESPIKTDRNVQEIINFGPMQCFPEMEARYRNESWDNCGEVNSNEKRRVWRHRGRRCVQWPEDEISLCQSVTGLW